MLNNEVTQPSKYRTKHWVEICMTHMENMTTRQIKSKTVMLKLSLWDYSDKLILEKGTITIARETDTKAVGLAEKRNKGVIFKNCAPFTDCISEINNTQIDNGK